MQLGGKVPAKENKKICQMVTTTIWHRIDRGIERQPVPINPLLPVYGENAYCPSQRSSREKVSE
mgnify:CR=1 FL=1